jgi:hypothetical protein
MGLMTDSKTAKETQTETAMGTTTGLEKEIAKGNLTETERATTTLMDSAKEKLKD